MEDWQERVIQERKDLNEKIKKLEDFLKPSLVKPVLEQHQRVLLRQQLRFMRGYLETLDERIEDF